MRSRDWISSLNPSTRTMPLTRGQVVAFAALWMVRYALIARQHNADQRGLVCGIPWKWREALELSNGLARMIIDSAIPPVFWRLFLLTTLLSMASKKNCMNPMKRGVAGMDAFAAAVAHWGSQEHEGKRARHTYYMALLVIFVWLEVALPLGRQSTEISLVGWNPTCLKKNKALTQKPWTSFDDVPLQSQSPCFLLQNSCHQEERWDSHAMCHGYC